MAPDHGTNGGYLAHRRRSEDACAPCRAAHAELARVTRQTDTTPKPALQPHGTRAAYERERRAWAAGEGPAPCAACRAGNTAAANARNRNGNGS